MMKRLPTILLILLAAGTNVRAEETLRAELQGDAEVWGIAPGGWIVEDENSQYARHDVVGTATVTMKDGQVYRIETYTFWNAANDVSCQVKETLFVSGGTYTGWSEHYLLTKTHMGFSRNVIDGTVQQEIKPDGSGFVEWTVASDGNATDDGTDTSAEDSDHPLPEVSIDEEGEFDGVSDRRLEIATHDGESTVTFRDDGYTRFTFERKKLGDRLATVTQKVALEGKGKGDLSYDPDEDAAATPTPTPTATSDDSGDEVLN